MKHIPPKFKVRSFSCPLCSVVAQQTWSDTVNCVYEAQNAAGQPFSQNFRLMDYAIAKCSHCSGFSFWHSKSMVYPITGNVEEVNDDMPDDIKIDYNEAKRIVNLSPRGSAALLRLAVQKLCIYLGEPGKKINDDIASLVKKGLPFQMQQALDSVRVIGNNAVHPGTLDLNDNSEVAFALFGFVNIICDVLISQPKKINEFYEKYIPESVKEGIEKRDNK